ncbi:MAG: HAD family hydrolase [Nitrososphaerales archaeon]
MSSAKSGITPFSAIVFDCDGVLIDASRSYDLTLELCAKAFGSLLGFKFQSERLREIVESLRRLGTFNNDWDTLAVIIAFMYARSSASARFDFLSIGSLTPASSRLGIFEERTLQLMDQDNLGETIDFLDLRAILESTPRGAPRDEIISKLITDAKTIDQFYATISYPGPVGESLLGTFFDEAMYGNIVFKNTYGFECSTSKVSKPGLIMNERLIVEENTLETLSRFCSGCFGIITGRPRVPTIFSLGRLFDLYFKDRTICVFTGDYLLDSEELKPAPKPMLRLASALKDRSSPILYVGDSGEDLLLVQRANATKRLGDQKIYFAAIASSNEKARFFESEGGKDVDCIVSNVNELPTSLLRKIEPRSKL